MLSPNPKTLSQLREEICVKAPSSKFLNPTLSFSPKNNPVVSVDRFCAPERNTPAVAAAFKLVAPLTVKSLSTVRFTSTTQEPAPSYKKEANGFTESAIFIPALAVLVSVTSPYAITIFLSFTFNVSVLTYVVVPLTVRLPVMVKFVPTVALSVNIRPPARIRELPTASVLSLSSEIKS